MNSLIFVEELRNTHVCRLVILKGALVSYYSIKEHMCRSHNGLFYHQIRQKCSQYQGLSCTNVTTRRHNKIGACQNLRDGANVFIPIVIDNV